MFRFLFQLISFSNIFSLFSWNKGV